MPPWPEPEMEDTLHLLGGMEPEVEELRPEPELDSGVDMDTEAQPV